MASSLSFKTKTLFLFLAILILAAGAYWTSVGFAKARVKNFLIDLKINETFIDTQNIKILMHGFLIEDLKLDAYGFSNIERIDVHLSWPDYFLNGKVRNIQIEKLNLTVSEQDLDAFILKMDQTVKSLFSFAFEEALLNSAKIILETDLFGIVTLDLNSQAQVLENNNIAYQAQLKTMQLPLQLNTQINGTFFQNGDFDSGIDILDGKIASDYLTLNRFSGWAHAQKKAKEGMSASVQIQAGSAKILKIPFQSFDAFFNHNDEKQSLSVRAHAAGYPEIRFLADADFAKEREYGSIQILSNSAKNLLDLIVFTELVDPDVLNKIDVDDIKDTSISLQLQPERRFVGGPLPFVASVSSEEETLLDGNFLLYPDESRIKGALEITDKSLRPLFLEDPEEKFFRFDSDLNDLWVSTAVESDLGERP